MFAVAAGTCGFQGQGGHVSGEADRPFRSRADQVVAGAEGLIRWLGAAYLPDRRPEDRVSFRTTRP